MRRFVVGILILVAAVASADLPAPPDPIHQRLLEADSPGAVRRMLAIEGARLAATDPDEAAEAYLLRGHSLVRAGMGDSAMVEYGRAVELRHGHAERLALVDLLLDRHAPPDLDEARRQVALGAASVGADPAEYGARRAWASFLAGRADSAAAQFAPVQEALSRRPIWRYRMARVAQANEDQLLAFRLLLPLAVASRMHDSEIADMMKKVGRSTSTGNRAEDAVGLALNRHDQIEESLLKAFSGERVRFYGADGFPLGGLVFPATKARRARAVVVIPSPGDTLVDYDGFLDALTRAGFSVVMLETRGSGGSVGELCPLPDTWRGREEQLQRLCARDVRSALRALASQTPVDTSRYVVVGVGASAPIAVLAAETEPRPSALVIVSPRPVDVEAGPMRAGIARARRPVFMQLGFDDLMLAPTIDALANAADPRTSRRVDSTLPGGGGSAFADPANSARLVKWLDETLAARRAPATPPARRRRG